MKQYCRVRGGCKLCLMCVYECPVGAIEIHENVSVYIDPDKCIGCKKCLKNCQAEAIEIVEMEDK